MQLDRFVSTWSTPLVWAALGSALVALAGIVGGVTAARRRRFAAALASSIVVLLCLSLSGIFVAVAVGIRGFETLTRETTAARVLVRPVGRQTFEAQFEFADGRVDNYLLRGDELYVDAHILKWKSVANWFGLHTQYELDRVAGRYRGLEDEQNSPRTVYGLSRPRSLDLFDFLRRTARFTPLVDAQYGSATFILADRSAAYEIRVSTSGLLVRQVPNEAETSRSSERSSVPSTAPGS